MVTNSHAVLYFEIFGIEQRSRTSEKELPLMQHLSSARWIAETWLHALKMFVVQKLLEQQSCQRHLFAARDEHALLLSTIHHAVCHNVTS